MTEQTRNLIKRTALANMRRCEAPMTEKEKPIAMKNGSKILLYFTALNCAVADIKFEFDSVGKYRHAEKANINEIERIVAHLFNSLRNGLAAMDADIIRDYDDWNTRICVAIDEAVLLEAPERSVNIALAVCREIMKLNDTLGRFCILAAMPLPHIIRKLERLGIRDYHIDKIIEMTLNKEIQ